MITKHINMKTLIHRLMHWLFPEIPPPKVPKTTHRVEDVPALVKSPPEPPRAFVLKLAHMIATEDFEPNMMVDNDTGYYRRKFRFGLREWLNIEVHKIWIHYPNKEVEVHFRLLVNGYNQPLTPSENEELKAACDKLREKNIADDNAKTAEAWAKLEAYEPLVRKERAP